MWVVITKKMNYFKTVCLVLLFCECEGETGVQTFRRKPESIFVVEGENVRHIKFCKIERNIFTIYYF